MVECPKNSGDFMNLSCTSFALSPSCDPLELITLALTSAPAAVAEEIQHRLIHIFAKDEEGNRAFNGGNQLLNRDPHFKDYLQYHEFFNGNDGRGLGASHQTGW